jgi:hypothetical protein
MKYYLIEITTYMDETPDAKGIYSYDTETDAVAAFHSKMGGAMKNVNYASEYLRVFYTVSEEVPDKELRKGYWKRPVVVTPEPVVEAPAE